MANRALLRNGLLVTGSIEVQNAVTASAFSGDGSALTGISTDPFPYTGSAIITGSLEVIGDTTGDKFIIDGVDYNYLNTRIKLGYNNTGISLTSTNEIHFIGNNIGALGIKANTYKPEIRLKSSAVFGFCNANINGGIAVNLNLLDSNTIRIGTGNGWNASGSLLLTNLTASGHVSASTYYGDGSNLTGISSDPFPYTGSAIITGSLEVIGNITGSSKFDLNSPNDNVIIGKEAGQNDPSNQNVFVGYQAGQNVTAGKHVAIGYQAGRSMSSIQNVAIGHLAGGTGGAYNITIGADARRNSAGQANISIGHAAFRSHGSNNNSIGIGYAVGRFGGGTGAVLLGYQAGYNLSGDYNIGLGYDIGYNLTGEYNTVLGYQAGYNTSGSKNVILGYQAGYNLTGSNQLIIANTGSHALVTGDFANNSFSISGSLEVMGTQRSLYTTQSFQYDGSNLTQITMSFENGTEEITNITYDGSNVDTIVITGSDGINKTYTLSYDGSGNVTNIIVS